MRESARLICPCHCQGFELWIDVISANNDYLWNPISQGNADRHDICVLWLRDAISEQSWNQSCGAAFITVVLNVAGFTKQKNRMVPDNLNTPATACSIAKLNSFDFTRKEFQQETSILAFWGANINSPLRWSWKISYLTNDVLMYQSSGTVPLYHFDTDWIGA